MVAHVPLMPPSYSAPEKFAFFYKFDQQVKACGGQFKDIRELFKEYYDGDGKNDGAKAFHVPGEFDIRPVVDQ